MTRSTELRTYLRYAIVPAGVLFVSIVALAQCPIGQIALPDDNPLGSIVDLRAEEPISTSFADANDQVVWPDGFSPPLYRPLLRQPIGRNGGFVLGTGAYEAVLRSFCLHAGKHGPSQGDGYLYAPLRGPRSPIITSLLRASASHREIAQHDVQGLIWAIEARARFSDLNPELQRAAATLLTKKQIYELNGGALGLIPQAVMDRALAAVPPEARRIYETQAELRRQLSRAAARFEDLERIAVLDGPADQDGPPVPRGRWSVHPGGFLVRYLPDGYSETTVQIYVPAPGTRARLLRQIAAGPAGTPDDGPGGPGGPGGSGGSGGASDTPVPDPEYDPSTDVAVPANTGAQRLGLSSVPREPDPCQTLTQTSDRYRRYDEPHGSPCEELAKLAKLAQANFDALDVLVWKAYDAWLTAFDARTFARQVLGECQELHGSSGCAKQQRAYDQAMADFDKANQTWEKARDARDKARKAFDEALDKYINCKKRQDPAYQPPLNCS